MSSARARALPSRETSTATGTRFSCHAFCPAATAKQEKKRIERQFFKLPSARQRAGILERHFVERDAATSSNRDHEA